MRTNKRERLLASEASPVTTADVTALKAAAAVTAAADGSDPATTQALANDLKAKFNALATAVDAL